MDMENLAKQLNNLTIGNIPVNTKAEYLKKSDSVSLQLAGGRYTLAEYEKHIFCSKDGRFCLLPLTSATALSIVMKLWEKNND